jgi:hypothetical protein
MPAPLEEKDEKEDEKEDEGENEEPLEAPDNEDALEVVEPKKDVDVDESAAAAAVDSVSDPLASSPGQAAVAAGAPVPYEPPVIAASAKRPQSRAHVSLKLRMLSWNDNDCTPMLAEHSFTIFRQAYI